MLHGSCVSERPACSRSAGGLAASGAVPGATLGKLFTHVCLCSPSSINWYRPRLGVKCTTGACWACWQPLSADLAVGGQPAPLQHRSYLWLPLYSGLEVTCHLRRYINCRYFTFTFLTLTWNSVQKTA